MIVNKQQNVVFYVLPLSGKIPHRNNLLHFNIMNRTTEDITIAIYHIFRLDFCFRDFAEALVNDGLEGKALGALLKKSLQEINTSTTFKDLILYCLNQANWDEIACRVVNDHKKIK